MAARDNYGQGYGGRSTYNPWGALQGRQEQSATTPKKAFDNGKPAAAPKKAFNDGEAGGAARQLSWTRRRR